MRRYLSRKPKKEYASGVRLVHNFYPGPRDDPGRDREIGEGGFRIWVTDEPIEQTIERRCACGWLGREHYGTVHTWPRLGRDEQAAKNRRAQQAGRGPVKENNHE